MADMQKFKELVLYLSEQSAEDKKFGATKLNKLLYFCDFLANVRLGSPITGVKYFRLGNGPAPRCLVPSRLEMISDGEIALRRVALQSGNVQERTVALRFPNLSYFSSEEKCLIDAVLADLKDLDAEEVSDLSHNEMGWIVTREKETIPYALAFYSNAPLSEEEIARGQQLAESRVA